MTTIRELVDALAELAAVLPDHDDTEVDFGICDGSGVQILNSVDLDHYARVKRSGEVVRRFVLLRGHLHPGEKPGQVLRGLAENVDAELRDLTDDDGETDG